MLLLECQSAGSVPRRQGGSHPVQLRVRANGQLVELPLGKTMIGTSPRCNLRVEQPGVQPLHCLIVHGPQGLRVRRWAEDTQLNGMPFDDAPLIAGDLLTLGDVELELVSPQPVRESFPDDPEWAEEGYSVTGETAFEAAPAVSETDGGLIDAVQESVDMISSLDDTAPVASVPENPDPVSDLDEACIEVAKNSTGAEMEATEVVFRQLQTACAMSRGRTRRMLASLRSQRELNQDLAQRLAEVNEQLAELDRQRADWETSCVDDKNQQQEWQLELQDLRRQLDKWEERLAEHMSLMGDLRHELVVAHENRLPATSSAHTTEVLPIVEPAMPNSEPAREPPTSASREPALFEPIEHPAVGGFASLLSKSPAEESSVCEETFLTADDEASESLNSVSESNAKQELAQKVLGSEIPASPPLHWGEITPARESSEHGSLSTAIDVGAIQMDHPAGIGEESSATSVEQADEIPPIGELSIWKQLAEAQQGNCDDSRLPATEVAIKPTAAWGRDTVGDVANENDASYAASAQARPSDEEEEEPELALADNSHDAVGAITDEPAARPARKPDTTSFIERYSHLLADDEAVEPVAKPEGQRPLAEEPVPPTINAVGVVRNEVRSAPVAASEEEESIEQYMAKLLQRMRGESQQGAPTTTAAAITTTSDSSATPTTVLGEHSEPARGESSASDTDAAQAVVDWEAIARRAAAAPKTDLGALRALANETARRAIGRHELKKHRRNTVTRVIVAILAGTTSLWLMLEAPNWRHIQFIAGGVSLLIAAYWSGKAFREMLRSRRAAAYDGPKGIEAYNTGLPIDVEG